MVVMTIQARNSGEGTNGLSVLRRDFPGWYFFVRRMDGVLREPFGRRNSSVLRLRAIRESPFPPGRVPANASDKLSAMREI